MKDSQKRALSKVLLIITAALLIVVTVGFLYAQGVFGRLGGEVSEEGYHIHAGFTVFNEDGQIDLSGAKYMSLSPCSSSAEDFENDPAYEQAQRAHLHDNIGNVVHVHREGAAWGDLFVNLGFDEEFRENLIAFENGERIEDLLMQRIDPYARVVFFVGESAIDEGLFDSPPSRERIIEVEAMGESCSSGDTSGSE